MNCLPSFSSRYISLIYVSFEVEARGWTYQISLACLQLAVLNRQTLCSDVLASDVIEIIFEYQNFSALRWYLRLLMFIGKRFFLASWVYHFLWLTSCDWMRLCCEMVISQVVASLRSILSYNDRSWLVTTPRCLVLVNASFLFHFFQQSCLVFQRIVLLHLLCYWLVASMTIAWVMIPLSHLILKNCRVSSSSMKLSLVIGWVILIVFQTDLPVFFMMVHRNRDAFGSRFALMVALSAI